MDIICGVCGQVVKKRANAQFKAPNRPRQSSNRLCPVWHVNPETGDGCHGFFEEGKEHVE